MNFPGVVQVDTLCLIRIRPVDTSKEIAERSNFFYFFRKRDIRKNNGRFPPERSEFFLPLRKNALSLKLIIISKMHSTNGPKCKNLLLAYTAHIRGLNFT